MITQAEFEAFDRKNPKVWEMFERFAFQAIRRGYRNFSADMIWQRMRWETAMENTDPEFKLNNNYRAKYGRKFMRVHPEYDGFFRTRERQGETDDGP